MSIQTTYTDARARFASLCDTATTNREVIIIQRRGAEDVALIAADELESLLETAHLLRSPENARRLLAALERALQRSGKAESLESFRKEMGLACENPHLFKKRFPEMPCFTLNSGVIFATGWKQTGKLRCGLLFSSKRSCAILFMVSVNRNR